MSPFFASSQINFLKQAAKRVLPKPVGRKLPITVDILLAIFKLLDFRHPLHVFNVKFGRWRPPPDRPFRTPRPGFEKTTISIEFKYHSTQKASYRIKRGLIQILSGHVLEWIETGIFYRFLNIYKILRLLREQNIVRFQRPKITSDTWFLTEKDIPR